MKDPYLYHNSDVLVNLFDEKNEQKFEEIEANFTSFRIRQLCENQVKGNFDFVHLCQIHKFIFQDLFDWAGHRLDYYAKKLETSPTHYIYVIEFKPNEEKFFFNNSDLKLFTHKEEYQEKSIIHLLDTSPNINEVKGKLKQYRFIKEITEYKVD